MPGSQPSTPPGWYHAEGDPPGTQRYWDGFAWQGGPQTPPSAPSPGQWGTAPYGGGHPGFPVAQYPEASQATTALVMSILGFFCCGILSAVGWYLGQQELNAIDAGRRDPTNRGTANAARIIGLILTVIFAAFIGLYIVAIAAAI